MPEDLAKLSQKDIETVAKDIRQEILHNVSRTGGHLAPSLGVVELTLALHAVLHSPQDKIIWDVGHQSYPHKLLTGRLKSFSTLRQKDGISGFTKRSESPHDIFGAGHASTSISAALGIADARDLKKEDFAVFAVIGDGALSGGLAFEALNNVKARPRKKFCIILNDNDMSINKPVGTISNIITNLRMSKVYLGLREKIERMLRHIPQIGHPLADKMEKFVERTRELLLAKAEGKVSALFEEFGFRYIGPLDGHNLPMLMGAIRYAKEADQPILLHVLTKKGKGYAPAEADPTKFHGIAPLPTEPETIPPTERLPTYTEIFGKTVLKLADLDRNIVAITAAMAEGTGLTEFSKKYPQRFYDVGIAEEHAVTFAAGLATQGLRPIVAIYSTFLQRAYDQIVHDVCLQKLPVIFALDRGGIVGEDGATHGGVFDYSYLRHIPELVVMAPKDENELQHMFYTATKHPGPVSIRYPRGLCQGVALDQQFQIMEIGKAELVYRSPYRILPNKPRPKKITLAAIGTMVSTALTAAKQLEQEGFLLTVINARFVKPLDNTLILEEANSSDLLVTVEENVAAGGFGSAILELLAENNVQVKTKCLAIPDEFIIQGSPEEVRAYYQLDSAGIVQRIRTALQPTESSINKASSTGSR